MEGTWVSGGGGGGGGGSYLGWGLTLDSWGTSEQQVRDRATLIVFLWCLQGASNSRLDLHQDETQDLIKKSTARFDPRQWVWAKTVVTATLSCDHRTVDGAVGAAWLQEFRNVFQTPALLLL